MAISGILDDFVARDPCAPKRGELPKWDLHAKNKYIHKVHVANWWYHREGYPKDHDDLVHASYDRWGTWKEDESHWKTETKEAMEEGRGNEELNLLKQQVKPIPLLTFLSYPLTLVRHRKMDEVCYCIKAYIELILRGMTLRLPLIPNEDRKPCGHFTHV